MKKIAFFTVLIGCFAISMLAAQAGGTYVRKKIKPSFFMPEEKTAKGEILPAFPALEKGILKVSDDGVILVKKNITNYVPSAKEKELPMPLKARKQNSYEENEDVATTYTPDEGLGDDFSKSERYLAMQKAYNYDLQVIAQTGQAPQNEQLTKDLQKMSSEKRFEVK
ncbi:MAG: hypothetical protein J6Y53_03755 [Alphaproteobacteria bacterium]|nr:hypothetical protein [Alphaproteobacteria bacterium]